MQIERTAGRALLRTLRLLGMAVAARTPSSLNR
jgi:hypothetical protein